MVQVFIGAFYGIPLFPPDQAPSMEQLHSLQEWLLSQYYLHRDSLTSALLSYATQQGAPPTVLGPAHQYEDRVNVEYQQCFKMQVSLARLGNFIRRESEIDSESSGGGVFRLPSESCIDYANFSASKLSKMVGCLVDTLLALSAADGTAAPSSGPSSGGVSPKEEEQPLALVGSDNDPFSQPQHVRLLTEEECRVLFYTLCIHGIPKMHARAIALLIKYGGSQSWWGGFIVKVAADLFGGQQAAIFNKER